MPPFPPPVQHLYETALLHEQSSEWGAAATCYEQAVTLVTDSPELWARYGMLIGREGVKNTDDHIALSAFARAAKCPATTAKDLYWRGIGARFNDGDGDARRDLSASLALDPTRAEAWYHYAEALEHPAAYFSGVGYDPLPEGQAKRLAAYNQALALDPGNAQYLAGRGNFHLAHDRLDEALADLNDALAQNPSNGWAMKSRAIIRFLRQDFWGAVHDFAAIRPLNGGWRNGGIVDHIRYPAAHLPPPAERWAAALAVFEQAGIREPATAAYLSGRAEYFLEHTAPERALQDAWAVVRLQPNAIPHRELLIECLLAQATPDWGALLAEYEWLAERPLPRVPKKREVPSEQALHLARRRWHQTCYRHHAAWAAFRLERPETAQRHFAAACTFAFTESPFEVKRDTNFRRSLFADPAEQDTRVPYRKVETVINGRQYLLGEVEGLLPPLPDPVYLHWQLIQQLEQEHANKGTLRAASQWLNQAAWQLAGPALGEACEACLQLLLPAGYHFVRPREAVEFDAARELCRAGLVQLPAHAVEFRLLQRALLRAELRDTQNQPGVTTATVQAALDRYDTALAALQAGL
ncbi:hypothetical protein GCM10022408_37980 [Hymenobacter fastidiosus]|uniref:Tetratricopeptide repeat protein n=1 Tax=Hymenobacter fastidiosus TaxID=486264 RepID=A0ABP7T3G4_9BACT